MFWWPKGFVQFNSQQLTAKESRLLALSVAANEKYQCVLGCCARGRCHQRRSSRNTGRHFVDKDVYTNAQAGTRMSIMMAPVLGKEFFELISLVVSAVNGCEMCVRLHEESVLKHGASEARVLDAIRLGAVLKGLITVL